MKPFSATLQYQKCDRKFFSDDSDTELKDYLPDENHDEEQSPSSDDEAVDENRRDSGAITRTPSSSSLEGKILV